MKPVALLLGACFCLPLAAQRFELTPLAGARTGGTFRIQREDQDSEYKVTYGAGFSYGFSAGVRFDSFSLVEFRWSRMRSNMDLGGVPGIQPGTTSPLRLDQYHGDFTREFPMEDDRYVRPYLTGSVGATRFTGSGTSFTRASFGIGGGFNFFPRSRVGIRLQGQYLPLWITPEVRGFACGGFGCSIVIGGKFVDQAEVTIGPVFRF